MTGTVYYQLTTNYRQLTTKFQIRIAQNYSPPNYIPMILIEKGTANSVILTLKETTTFPNATYLLEFIHTQTRQSQTCIAVDTSAFPTRYNQFEITETTNADGSQAQVELELEGFYTYKVYAQLSETNLVPTNADETVESGFAYITGTAATTHTYTPSTSNAFVYNG